MAENGRSLDRALEYTRRAVALDKENGAYLDSLGWTLFKLKRYDKAESYLTRAVQHMEDPVIREHLGSLYYALGDKDRAVKEWQKSIDGGSETPEILREKIQRAQASP